MRRRWPRYALVCGLTIAVMVGAVFAMGGLRPCERLDDRLCRDLGPDDCAIWKDQLGRVGSGSRQRHSWRGNRMVFVDLAIHKVLGWDAAHSDNPLCNRQMGEQLYPAVLSAVRDAVAGHRTPAGGR